MRAWVFREPKRMQIEEMEIPSITDNDLLVKVRAVGICGSDIPYYFGHSPLGSKDGKGPLVLGQADKAIKFSWLAPLVWPETLAAGKEEKIKGVLVM